MLILYAIFYWVLLLLSLCGGVWLSTIIISKVIILITSFTDRTIIIFILILRWCWWIDMICVCVITIIIIIWFIIIMWWSWWLYDIHYKHCVVLMIECFCDYYCLYIANFYKHYDWDGMVDKYFVNLVRRWILCLLTIV